MLHTSKCTFIFKSNFFHALQIFRLCEHTITQFDPVLNNKHLQESLKLLLKLYDESEYISNKCLADGDKNKHINYNCRQFFEALYVVFNLGDVSAILRGLSLEKKWRLFIANVYIH